MNDSVIEKIKKLLRLGTSPNRHEAELAMQKALEIAQANDIELATINPNVDKSSIGEDAFDFGQRLPVIAQYVFSIITSHFDVKVIYTGNRNFGRKAILVGTADKIAVAKYVFEFLSEAMDRDWKQYYQISGVPLAEKKNYLIGFRNGLSHKLFLQKKQKEQENSCLALMIVSNNAAIQQYVDEKIGKNIKTRKEKAGTATSSYFAGYTKGQNTEIAKGAIENEIE